MPSPAITAQGSTLEIETATPDSFVTIGGVVSFAGLDGNRPMEDVSTLASSAREKRPGLKDSGTFSIDLYRDDDDAGQARLRAIDGATTTNALKVTLSNGDVYEMEVYVNGFDIKGELDGSIRATCGFEISGDYTVTTA